MSSRRDSADPLGGRLKLPPLGEGRAVQESAVLGGGTGKKWERYASDRKGR